MTVELKFNLPEEDAEYYMAAKGKDSFFALWDLREAIRTALKYTDKPSVERLQKKFFEIIEVHDINFDRVP